MPDYRRFGDDELMKVVAREGPTVRAVLHERYDHVLEKLEDNDLMLLVGRDDAAALELLQKRYTKTLWGIAVSVYPAADTRADDFVAEVWLRVIHASARFRPEHPGTFRCWLWRIAKNLAATHANERRREVALDDLLGPDADGESFEISAGPETDPMRILTDRERASAVWRAVQALKSQEQREALVLRYWRGLSYVEIEETMNLSNLAVKSLLHRALRNVKRYLEGEGYGYAD